MDQVDSEGLPTTIKRMVNELRLRWERRIRANFAGMVAAFKNTKKLPFDDLAVDNFPSVLVAFDRHWRQFKTGRAEYR